MSEEPNTDQKGQDVQETSAQKSAEEVSAPQETTTAFCRSCGTSIHKDAAICPKCGVRQMHHPTAMGPNQPKSLMVALLLSIFVGGMGIDRFYLGLIGTGLLKLLTAGGCGIWYLIDIILIATNSIKDSNGNRLV